MTTDKVFHNVLSEVEASEYIAMSISFLRQSRMHGGSRKSSTPPFIKIGRSVRYLKSDLDEWLDARKVNFTSIHEDQSNR